MIKVEPVAANHCDIRTQDVMLCSNLQALLPIFTDKTLFMQNKK